MLKQGKSEGFDSCDRPYNLKWDTNRFFSLCDLEIWPCKTIKNLFHVPESYACHFLGILQKCSNRSQMGHFSACVTLKIDRWHKKNYRTPLLCPLKLWTSFHNHLWIQTGITVQKRSIRVKIINFLLVWPWNLMDDLGKIKHLFYATSSFVHYFVAICKLKLELRSGNTQIGGKICFDYGDL